MKKGFTLLELVVVIVIIGILATLGLVQYAKVMEKSRTAEARTSLGLLRTLQSAYFQDKGTTYGTVTDLIGTGLPVATSPNYYFYYGCSASDGLCTATRCTSTASASCKQPPGTSYTITMSTGGTLTEGAY